MSEDFTSRYLQRFKVSAPDKTAARERFVSDVVKSLSRGSVATLLALVHGAAPQNDSSLLLQICDGFNVAGVAVDTSNQAEAQFLGEEIALGVIRSGNGPIADLVAIGIITSDLCGLAKRLRRTELLSDAGAYLKSRQAKRRAAASTAPRPSSTKAALEAMPAGDYSVQMSQLRPVFEALEADAENDRKYVRAFSEARFLEIDEQLSVTSLCLTRYSPSGDSYYSELSDSSPLYAAQDLSDATRILPGLGSSRRFLSEMLNDDGTRVIDLKNVLNVGPKPYPKEPFGSQWSQVATPILWALVSATSEGKPSVDILTETLNVEWSPVSSLKVAVHTYFEHTFARIVSESHG